MLLLLIQIHLYLIVIQYYTYTAGNKLHIYNDDNNTYMYIILPHLSIYSNIYTT